jgi:hypothetical protein
MWDLSHVSTSECQLNVTLYSYYYEISFENPNANKLNIFIMLIMMMMMMMMIIFIIWWW